MKTPISYYGGKQTMLKYILPLIPSHKLYTEAFCGGAAVLFAKRPADGEIINDIDMDITNFYWMAKAYYHDLKQEIEKDFAQPGYARPCGTYSAISSILFTGAAGMGCLGVV